LKNSKQKNRFLQPMQDIWI